MTEAQIKSTIKNRLQELYEQYPFTKEMCQDGFVAGGAIPSMIAGDYVKDYDIFLKTNAALSKLKQHMENVMRPANINVIDTENAVTLIHINDAGKETVFQIIKRTLGPTASDILVEFDFEHLKCWYDIKEDEIHVPDHIYKILHNKQIFYTGSKYPLSSLLRLRKYMAKGWKVSAKQMIKIAFDIAREFSGDLYPKSMVKSLLELDTEPENADLDDWFEDKGIDGEEPFEVNVNHFIDQVSGIDPLFIQERLREKSGKTLPVSDIINLIDENI